MTDLVLQTFAGPAWEDIEAAWLRGDIDAATCMRRQVPLIYAEPGALDRLLDTVSIDPGFPGLVAWCQRSRTPLTVVSDGVDYFIRRILERHGFPDIPIVANRLVREAGGLRLEQPFAAPACQARSGVCKCAVTASATRVVYIGDGRSDECVAHSANLLFAKDKLAAYCTRMALPYVPYTNFHDVREALCGGVSDLDTPRHRNVSGAEAV